jgi:hypothetical protein
MKHRFAWASALALAVTVSSQVNTTGITNGVIFISTREPQDTAAGVEYFSSNNGEPGPGMTSPGDVAMGALLADYGYSCRILLDRLLGDTAGSYVTTPPGRDTFMFPLNTNLAPMLLIVSGSSASAVIPFPTQTNGVPMMMGEHSGLGDRVLGGSGSTYMYTRGTQSTDPNGNAASGPSKYMKVINPTHPIMQGIPLDAQGRVKIFREPYPEELAHTPTTGRQNYEYRWCAIPASNAAPATTVLGVLDGQESYSVFAVAAIGGLLADNPNLGYAETNQVRLVHIFTNEQGSGGPRRVFLSLTDIARVIFVRAAKWAMGETLQPYQGIGLIDISLVGTKQIQLSWQGSASKNYKILATTNLLGPADFSNWQTVVQDIPGTNGVVARRLDISAGPQYAFLRVAPMP